MIVKRLHDDPVPPSKRTELMIPPELERIVMQCLARDPAARPQSALDVDEALAALPVPRWTAADAAEWWKVRGILQLRGDHDALVPGGSDSDVSARRR